MIRRSDRQHELDANAAENLTSGLEQLSDRDRNFAAYIEILDRVEGLLARLKMYEIPDREQKSFRLSLPTLTYTECPGNLGDVLSLEEPLELDITLTREVNVADVRAENTPQELQSFYGVSISVSDTENTVYISRDKSVGHSVPSTAEAFMEPASDVFLQKGGEPQSIARIGNAAVQKLVLLATGYNPEELDGIDLDQTDIFAPEKASQIEGILYDSCLESHKAVEYEFPEQDAHITATYHTSADTTGDPSESLQLFSITFGEPKQFVTLQLDTGLEVSVGVGDNKTPDSSEVVKFVEALIEVTHSIERRRPRVITATNADITDLESRNPDIELL